jgi:hypothetical protein
LYLTSSPGSGTYSPSILKQKSGVTVIHSPFHWHRISVNSHITLVFLPYVLFMPCLKLFLEWMSLHSLVSWLQLSYFKCLQNIWYRVQLVRFIM